MKKLPWVRLQIQKNVHLFVLRIWKININVHLLFLGIWKIWYLNKVNSKRLPASLHLITQCSVHLMSSSAGDAAHEFGALNTLLLVVILGLCILSAYLIKQNSFYYLPESACAILVGIVVGCLAKAIYPSSEEMQFLSFEPQMFFFLLLPPIIFEAGYALRKKDFFANFWTVSLYAVFGTIISTFIIGYLVYAIGLTGMIHIDTSSPLEALMFGSLISAVDPVATLSVCSVHALICTFVNLRYLYQIMGNPELNCDPLLYSLVFGESVLNDAVAIVLFKTFAAFYDSGETFSGQTIPTVMINFTVVSVLLLSTVLYAVVLPLTSAFFCSSEASSSGCSLDFSALISASIRKCGSIRSMRCPCFSSSRTAATLSRRSSLSTSVFARACAY